MVRVWRIRDGKRMMSFRTAEPLRSLALSPDGRIVATATEGDIAELWETVPGGYVGTLALEGHRGTINSIEFSRDGKLVVTAGDDGTVRVWRARDGEELATFREGRPGAALDAAFDRKGRRIAVGASDGSSDVFACPVCVGEKQLFRFAEAQAPLVP
jgi:WD40 repeat protein